MQPPDDRWSAGDAYEAFMGRWSRRVAQRYLDWLGAPAGLDWLEIGCGTGALTAAICRSAEPGSVIACDPSAAFVEHTRHSIGDERVTVVQGGADDPPQRDGGFDRIVSGLVLNFVPEPQAAVRRMRARLSGDGIVSAYVWDYAGRMDFLRIFWEEASAIDSGAAAHDERGRFPICDADALSNVFREAGAGGVTVEAIDTPTRFETFEDYWRPFLGGTGPAPAYVASLDAARRETLRRRLEHRLGAAGDGSIDLVARAWAVRGSH
jgi:SAM-dependent methyltransferase